MGDPPSFRYHVGTDTMRAMVKMVMMMTMSDVNNSLTQESVGGARTIGMRANSNVLVAGRTDDDD